MFGIDLSVLLARVAAILFFTVLVVGWCATCLHRHLTRRKSSLDAVPRPLSAPGNKLLEDLEFELAIAEDLHYTDVGDLRERIEKARNVLRVK